MTFKRVSTVLVRIVHDAEILRKPSQKHFKHIRKVKKKAVFKLIRVNMASVKREQTLTRKCKLPKKRFQTAGHNQ